MEIKSLDVNNRSSYEDLFSFSSPFCKNRIKG
jgi:hypothetical protein